MSIHNSFLIFSILALEKLVYGVLPFFTGFDKLIAFNNSSSDMRL